MTQHELKLKNGQKLCKVNMLFLTFLMLFMGKTQHKKILDLLDTGEWVCTSKMYAEYIADPRTRIAELKKKGYNLEWRWCESHNYHDGGSKEWRLEEVPIENFNVKNFIRKEA